MLRKTIDLRYLPDLKPFDEAILAAVLVKAGELPGEDAKVFCELDGDLAIKGKDGRDRPSFRDLYESAGIAFRTDFRVVET